MLHLELASAMATAQESDQHSTAVPHRSRHHLALHVGIPADDSLVPLILLPGEIALVVVANQHLPRLLRPADITRDQLTARFDANLRAGPTEHIGASINRIGQQPMDRIIARQPPFHHSAPGTVNNHRHPDAFIAQPSATWRTLPNSANLPNAKCSASRTR